MFHFRYDPITTFQILHDYYADRKSADLNFVPTRNTQEILAQNHLKFQQKDNLIHILIKKEKKGDSFEPFLVFDQPLKLSFQVFIDNPLFAKFTETEDKKSFYFSNLNEDGTLRNTLNKGDFVSKGDSCPPILSQQFSIPVQPGFFKSYKIFSTYPTVGKKELNHFNIETQAESISISLSESGRYTIEFEKSDGSGVENKDLYASSEIFNATPTAFVEYFIMPNNAIQPEKLTLKFIQKKAFWRYLLVDRKNAIELPEDNPESALKLNYSVNAGSALPSGINFKFIKYDQANPQDKATIDFIKNTDRRDILNAFLFVSDQEIPYLEKDYPTIKLSLDTNTLMDRMPIPNTEQFNSTIFFNV